MEKFIIVNLHYDDESNVAALLVKHNEVSNKVAHNVILEIARQIRIRYRKNSEYLNFAEDDFIEELRSKGYVVKTWRDGIIKNVCL